MDEEARPRWRRRVALGVVGFVAVWGAASAWMLWGARADLQAGASDLRAVREQSSIGGLLDDGATEELESAEGHFASAASTLDSPLLVPVGWLPGIGAQIDASARLADVGEQGAQVASRAVADLRPLAEREQGGGAQRLELLADLGALADEAKAGIEPLDVGSDSGLLPPLATAVREVGEQRDAAVEAADDLGRMSGALADVLDGPEPYLLIGANNAEMRHGSGMFLSASELRFDGGALELGEVQPTASLVLPAGAVPVDGELADNWPWLDHGRDLRTLGFTASFPTNAAIAARTWEATDGGGPVAGVIVVDVDALRALLRAVGPVEVDGIRYTPDNVRGELLREQYLRFSDDQAGRRDQVGEVARAVFDRIEAGEFELSELATQLAETVAGRHLMVWSSDPERQAVWEDVGAAGALDERSLAVGLISRSATKLDSWIESAVDIEIDGRAIEVELTIENTGPKQGPAYVVGPNAEGLGPGDHRGIVVVNLPAGTASVEIEGATPVLRGGDGPTVVVAGDVLVPNGEEVVVVVRGRLPEGLDALVLEPAARVPRLRWEIGDEPIERDRRTAWSLTD
jgi:hypothetical protein